MHADQRNNVLIKAIQLYLDFKETKFARAQVGGLTIKKRRAVQ